MVKILLFTFIMICNAAYASNQCNFVYGVNANYAPYEWKDSNGNIVGMNIDLLKAMAKEAGCSFSIVSHERNIMLNMMARGQIDVISSSPNHATNVHVLFLPHSVILYRYFFTRINAPDILKLSDLRHKRIAVLKDGFTEGYLSQIKDKYDMKLDIYSDRRDVVRSVSDGTDDATLVTMTFMSGALKELNIKNIKSSGEPILPTPYGFAVNKNDPELFTRLNNAITTLKENGKYFQIMQKWSSNQPNYVYLKKVVIYSSVAITVIILFILLWNKTLHVQVKKQTRNLHEEIETRIEIENELRKSRAAEAKLRDEAMVASKLAALGEMATSVAHEINNPVGLITHNIKFTHKLLDQLLKYAENSDPDKVFCNMPLDIAARQFRESDEIINDSINRIIRTVADLKEYGHNTADGYAVFDLRDCFRKSISMTSYFTKNYTNNLIVEMEVQPISVYGNHTHIEQVIINLIQNACFALKDLTGVIICKLYVDNVSKTAVISVEDNGCGMDEATKERACEPFFTMRKDKGGTGLGLSISSRIISEHNGKLMIESAMNEGSKIKLILPLYYAKGE